MAGLGESCSHVGASPDSVVMCDCCGLGSVEVKCPYFVKDGTIKDVQAKKKDFYHVTHGNHL